MYLYIHLVTACQSICKKWHNGTTQHSTVIEWKQRLDYIRMCNIYAASTDASKIGKPAEETNLYMFWSLAERRGISMGPQVLGWKY